MRVGERNGSKVKYEAIDNRHTMGGRAAPTYSRIPGKLHKE